MNDNYPAGRKNSGHLGRRGGGRKEGREGKERGKGKNIRPERSGEEIN